MRSRPSGGTLPAHFIDSLRVLFDILDTQRSGFVSIDQIDQKWQLLPKANLPIGFLECLRRVTPPDGLLTFERFMAGFRLALFNRQSAGRLQRVRSEGKLDEAGLKSPAMGINGLLVEHRRRQPQAFMSNNYHFQQHASALRAQNTSQLLTLQTGDHYQAVPRRPASAGANRHVGHVDRHNGNYSVILRNKKSSDDSTPPNSSSTNYSNTSGSTHPPSTKSTRAPAPPILQNGNYAAIAKSPPTNGHHLNRLNHFRPVSMTSSNSGSCSSGMGEVRWRDSTRLSSSNSPPDSLHRQYAEELQPQVAKHERLLDEETEVVEKGMQVTRNLLRWYEDRVESLQKRRRMLDKGMVALDSAVHEQKLNFHRAQITELNRRMTALMNSTKRGFPIHENMQNGLDESENGTVNSSPPIRNAVPPPGKTPQLTPQFLLKQNQKLAEELDAKSHMIEQLQRERRLAELRHAAHFNNNNDSLNGMNGKPPIQQRRSAAYIRPAISNYVAMPIKVHDTLL